MRLLILLLAPSLLFAGQLPTEQTEARYRMSSGDLVIDVGDCLVISEAILTNATPDWRPLTATPEWSVDRCTDPTWSVKKYRNYPDRPTYIMVNGAFEKTDQRVNVGEPCQGEAIKPCSRCDTKMQVGVAGGVPLYASCVSN